MLKRIKGFTLIELLIVVAIIAILAAIAVPNFLEAQTRSKVSRARADQRTLATALESYYVDNNSYPAYASSTGQGGLGANGGPGLVSQIPQKDVGLLLIPTFRVKKNANDPIATLTTPIAYTSTLTNDPFSDTKGAIMAYATQYGLGWLIWSYGPDADENSPVTQEYKCGGDIVIVKGNSTNPPTINETFYNPAGQVPSPSLIMVTYDPSNGTTSNGDVYRQKQ